MKHCIYKLVFPNGKIYVGQTNNFRSRMTCHKNDPLNPNRTSKCSRVHGAILKYGWENVKKEIICECDKSNVNELEIFWIKELKSNDRIYGYNICGGGHNSQVSDDTRRKISRARSGKRSWSKRVAQIDIVSNEVIKIWDSVMSIKKELGVSTSNISTMCNNTYKTCYQKGKKYYSKPKTAHGFKWKFTRNLTIA